MTDEVNNTDHVVAMQIICWETSGPGSHVDATFTRTAPPLATHWDNAPSHTAKNAPELLEEHGPASRIPGSHSDWASAGCAITGQSHRGPTLQPTAPKGSHANILLPDTQRRSCVHDPIRPSCFCGLTSPTHYRQEVLMLWLISI